MSSYKSRQGLEHMVFTLVASVQAVFDARAVVAIVHASSPPPQRLLIAELYAADVSGNARPEN